MGLSDPSKTDLFQRKNSNLLVLGTMELQRETSPTRRQPPIPQIQRRHPPLQVLQRAGIDDDIVGDRESLLACRLRGDHAFRQGGIDAVAGEQVSP
jgi:hypothetical protein